MKNDKMPVKTVKTEDLDTYFMLNDEKILVPDVELADTSAGQEQVEIRGFSHLRAVKNADGSYAGILTVGRDPN